MIYEWVVKKTKQKKNCLNLVKIKSLLLVLVVVVAGKKVKIRLLLIMDKVRQLHNGFSISLPGNENLFSKLSPSQTFSVKQMKYA